MKPSVVQKLETLVERFEEVQALLSDPVVIGDQNRFRALSKEYAQLEDVVRSFREYQDAQGDLTSAHEMLLEDDAEMREMAQEE
ncbi:MAG TPA: peptide chain release factor 1, partial [Glaciecola sp.]|nr:peptide chain release factor 1 [Glaciecola sp.]